MLVMRRLYFNKYVETLFQLARRCNNIFSRISLVLVRVEMKQSCSFQNLHVINQFYSFSYLYVLVLTNQKTFSVRSHVRSHGRFDVISHGRSHGRFDVIKTLAAISFAQRTKATYTKKPQPLGNLQNNLILAAKNTVNSRKCT